MSVAVRPSERETRSILLIDDHERMGRILSLFLRNTDLRHVVIDQVTSVPEATTLLQQGRYALVLLDNLVPPYGFRESLKIIESNIGKAPVVLLSGAPPQDIGEHEIDAMLSAVWPKDILSDDDLVIRLRKQLDHSTATD